MGSKKTNIVACPSPSPRLGIWGGFYECVVARALLTGGKRHQDILLVLQVNRKWKKQKRQDCDHSISCATDNYCTSLMSCSTL